MFVFPSPRLFAWPPALVLNLYLRALAPNLYLPPLVPNSYSPALAPNLYLPALASVLCLPVLAPNLHLPALVYKFITSPGAGFSIHRPCLLNFCLFLWSWPTICFTGLRLEFIFTLLLLVVAVVVVIVVIIISFG